MLAVFVCKDRQGRQRLVESLRSHTTASVQNVGCQKICKATLTLPSQDVGPLKVPVQRAGPGHFSAYNFTIPLRGDWKLEVKALLSDIDEATLSTTFPVK